MMVLSVKATNAAMALAAKSAKAMMTLAVKALDECPGWLWL